MGACLRVVLTSAIPDASEACQAEQCGAEASPPGLGKEQLLLQVAGVKLRKPDATLEKVISHVHGVSMVDADVCAGAAKRIPTSRGTSGSATRSRTRWCARNQNPKSKLEVCLPWARLVGPVTARSRPRISGARSMSQPRIGD